MARESFVPGALQTERLRLEPIGIAHRTELLAYRSRNREHLRIWEPTPADDALTDAYVARDVAAGVADAAAGENARFVVFERAATTIVGEFNLWQIARGIAQSATLGYSVDGARQGRGYATEAAGALVRHAFEDLNLHRIATSYQPINERSGRVLRKLGFVVEGYARDYLFLNSAWRDAILVSSTNAAWRPGDDAR